MGPVVLYLDPEVEKDGTLFDRIVSSVLWKDYCPDFAMPGRSCYFVPKKAISTEFGPVGSVQAKGISNFDGNDAAPPSIDDFYVGNGSMMDHHFDENGDRRIDITLIDPLGGMQVDSSEHEDDIVHGLDTLGFGYPVALGFGVYVEQRFMPRYFPFDEKRFALAMANSEKIYNIGYAQMEEQQLGMMFLGHQSKEPMRLSDCELETDVQERMYHMAGEQLRLMIESGVVHRHPHPGNMSYQEGKLCYHDFGSALRTEGLSPAQIAGYAMNIIDLYFMKSESLIYRELNRMSKKKREFMTKAMIMMSPDGDPQGLMVQDHARKYEAFMTGFFGRHGRLTHELCSIFNHVGFSSKNPMRCLEEIAEDNVFSVGKRQGGWLEKRGAWKYFRNCVRPMVLELAEKKWK